MVIVSARGGVPGFSRARLVVKVLRCGRCGAFENRGVGEMRWSKCGAWSRDDAVEGPCALPDRGGGTSCDMRRSNWHHRTGVGHRTWGRGLLLLPRSSCGPRESGAGWIPPLTLAQLSTMISARVAIKPVVAMKPTAVRRTMVVRASPKVRANPGWDGPFLPSRFSAFVARSATRSTKTGAPSPCPPSKGLAPASFPYRSIARALQFGIIFVLLPVMGIFPARIVSRKSNERRPRSLRRCEAKCRAGPGF